MHMLLEGTSLRSKADILRATQSTFKNVCADNAVKVDPVKTDKDKAQVLKYITEWASKDGHKSDTMLMDIKWRTMMGLEPTYEKGGLSSTTAP